MRAMKASGVVGNALKQPDFTSVVCNAMIEASEQSNRGLALKKNG